MADSCANEDVFEENRGPAFNKVGENDAELGAFADERKSAFADESKSALADESKSALADESKSALADESKSAFADESKSPFAEKKTLFYLLRHGQSEGNAREVILGHTDLGLTELGFKQAECAAQGLADVMFDRIYSSDLKRAMSTAEPNARLRGLEVIPDSRLRELYLGDWDGKSVREVAEQDHDMFFIQWRGLFGNFQSPNGESVPQLAERIYACLADLGRKHPGEVLLCATHAAAIRAFWGKISGIDPMLLGKTLPFPSNASCTLVEFDGETFTPIKYSYDDYFVDESMKTFVR